MTQHALLVLWGQFAQYLALPPAFADVPLHQKTYTHSPQTKLLEFLVAILAGLPHLKDLSHAAHPLDQDRAVALAWGQPAWADASGVCRSLQELTQPEAAHLAAVLHTLSRPFIGQEVLHALRAQGRVVFDGDLTGRPVANTSTSYPAAAYGHMSDGVHLGYQAALVSMHSPTYGRLWLGVTPHPGNTLSVSQAEALVRAAEAQTGVRPRRRVDLVQGRLAALAAHVAATTQHVEQAQAAEADVARDLAQTRQQLWNEQHQVAQLQADYAATGRPERPHSRLSQARTHVAAEEKRLARLSAELAQRQHWLAQVEQRLAQVTAEQTQLVTRLAGFVRENATNRAPIAAIFRLDAGFGSGANLTLLIELGYEVYTKPYSDRVSARLRRQVTAQTAWTRVGRNAEMTSFPALTVPGCPYPLDGALERFYTGETIRYSGLLHFGPEAVLADQVAWFQTYNARQTIEAGIKEGKGVFQMHHLKVRSGPALYLQEQYATFAANFVRWAGAWLQTCCQQVPSAATSSGRNGIKQQVQVGAHTSAWATQYEGRWVVEFTDQSVYAGSRVQTQELVFQLPLPLFRNCDLGPI